MRKAQQGKDYNFIWQAPSAISGTPSIIFHLESGDITSSMTQGRASLTATAISGDRRSLTLSASATSLKPFQSQAFLLTDGDDYFSIKPIRIVGTSLIIADPLPRDVSFTTSASIQFASWTYTASSATITADRGDIAFTIEYVQSLGGQTINKVEKGILKVVPRPFDTGLDHARLCAIFPHIADIAPRRANGFDEIIGASLDELALYVRDLIVPDDVDEDDIHNANELLQAHASLAIARIHEINGNIDLSEKMRNRGIELADLGMRTISLDLNKNGTVEDNELNIRAKGRGYITGNMANRIVSNDEKSFSPSRAMRH